MTTAQMQTFRWPVRVYYEDTDAGGIVYYANYLRFFERARTEWLRARGIDQFALREAEGLVFVVTAAAIEYRRPARLDDQLVITAEVCEAGRVSLVFAQTVLRGDELLVSATVKAACVNAQTMTPARLPAAMRNLNKTESAAR
jgi:acyl-CoA thioester hydrolase